MALSTILLNAALLAHLPSLGGDLYGTPDEAFPITDNELSIVLFDTVSCEVPEVWMTFETEAPDEAIFMQLGVPVIDRLADYRPAIALLGPGLPDIELPFEIPEGVGGVRFDATDMDEPIDFFEPFTMTSSWIWYEGTVTVPEPGQGWVVAWDPSRETGKLWVAIGTVEDFSGGIGVTFDEIYGYHETNGFEPEEEIVEQQCGGGEEGGDGGTSDSESGDAGETGAEAGLDLDGEGCSCSHEPTRGSAGALWLASLMLLLGLTGARRRKRA